MLLLLNSLLTLQCLENKVPTSLQKLYNSLQEPLNKGFHLDCKIYSYCPGHSTDQFDQSLRDGSRHRYFSKVPGESNVQSRLRTASLPSPLSQNLST